ncbi:uncharacterized protein ACRADG_007134 isoform 2-T3 [Cochliomyia hominivorax]
MNNVIHEDVLSGTSNKEKRKKYSNQDKIKKIYKLENQNENEDEISNKKENINSIEEDCENSQNETIYDLSKDVLLIHSNDNDINNEYEGDSHFMEIPSHCNEEEMENEHFTEKRQKDQDNKKAYDSINDLEGDVVSEINLPTTDLSLEDTERIPDYEAMVNDQNDVIQYQRIYVDESSIENSNLNSEILEDDFINKVKEENSEMQINQNNKKCVAKSSLKTESISHRFYCDKCDRDFSTKTNLNRHMQSHGGNKPFSCLECKKSFTQKSTLKQHMYIHTGERPYVCEVCNRGFTQCKSLIFHMRRHTGEKPFHCEYCLITFRQKDALRIHIIKHHVVVEQSTDGTEVFTCIICQKNFHRKIEFKIHMKVHTAPPELDNIVEFLGHEQERTTLNKTTIDSSISDLTNDNECINAAVVNISASSAFVASRAKKFQCRKCFKCFALKKSLVRHMRIHYAINSDDSAECFDCDLQFSSTEHYQEHLSECHQFACSSCPELIFKTIHELKNHMFQHELEQH